MLVDLSSSLQHPIHIDNDDDDEYSDSDSDDNFEAEMRRYSPSSVASDEELDYEDSIRLSSDGEDENLSDYDMEGGYASSVSPNCDDLDDPFDERTEVVDDDLKSTPDENEDRTCHGADDAEDSAADRLDWGSDTSLEDDFDDDSVCANGMRRHPTSKSQLTDILQHQRNFGRTMEHHERCQLRAITQLHLPSLAPCPA
jgi:hypothetical protein